MTDFAPLETHAQNVHAHGPKPLLRVRPVDPGTSSPGGRTCTCMEGFLNREWGPILPRCGETVGFPRGVTSAARTALPHWPRAGGGGALTNGIGAGKKRWEVILPSVLLYHR